MLRLDEEHGPYTAKDAIKYFFTTLPERESLIKRFQNDRRPLKLLQDVLWMAGNLIIGKNNIFDALTLSTQIAHWAMTNHLMEPMERLNSGVAEYARIRGISIKQALAELDGYFVAEHDQERRHDKWLRIVPFDNTDKFVIPELGQTERTAHEHRRYVYNELLTDPALKKKAEKGLAP